MAKVSLALLLVTFQNVSETLGRILWGSHTHPTLTKKSGFKLVVDSPPGFEGPATFLTSCLKALGVTSIAIIRFSFLIRHLEVWTRNSVKILPKSNLIGLCFFYDLSKILAMSMKILDLTPNALSSQIARQSAVQNEELGSPKKKKTFTGFFLGGTKNASWNLMGKIGSDRRVHWRRFAMLFESCRNRRNSPLVLTGWIITEAMLYLKPKIISWIRSPWSLWLPCSSMQDNL